MLYKLSVALAIQGAAAAPVASNRRHLSEPPILAYYPSSGVSDHNRIDVDQAAMEDAFGTCSEADLPVTTAGTCTGMARVKAIYQQGGGSAPQGQCTVASIATAFSKKDALEYSNDGGVTWTAKKTSASGAVGGTTIKFYYATSGEKNHDGLPDFTYAPPNTCVVGGIYQTTDANGDPWAYPTTCLATDGTNAKVKIGSDEYSCTAVDNTQAARTLQGFSTKAKKLMYDPTMEGSCPARDTSEDYMNGCPYTSYSPYFDYYCSGDAGCNANGGYADEIVLAAIESRETDLANGNVDFSQASGKQLKEIIKKGTAYMNAWMYAIREFEDAIDDCTGNALTNNDLSSGSVHAWDEGVAFYTGSKLETGHLSGATTAGDGGLDQLNAGIGKLAYDLGNKRCRNFATCGPDGGETSGQSQQNYELFKLFNEGQVDFRMGTCGPVVPVKNKIVQWMTIPLVQGTLRYAYETGPLASASGKATAEGAIFAMAVLPQVHACSADAAATIKAEMLDKIYTGGADYAAVKNAFEGCYSTMFPDIASPCAAVGSYGGSSGTMSYDDAGLSQTCTDPSPSSDDGLSGGGLIAIIVCAAVAGLLFLCLMYIYCTEKSSGKPMFYNLKANGGSA